MYENGKGVPQNIAEAVKWYRLAAEQGYAGRPEQSRPDLRHRARDTRDPLRAYMWFSLAATSLSGDVAPPFAQAAMCSPAPCPSRQIAAAKEMAAKCQASNFKDCEPSGDALAADPDAQPPDRIRPPLP
jgi:hypothetical protein